MRSGSLGKALFICRASREPEKAGKRQRSHKQTTRPGPTQRGTRPEKGRRGTRFPRRRACEGEGGSGGPGKAEAADRGRRERRTEGALLPAPESRRPLSRYGGARPAGEAARPAGLLAGCGRGRRGAAGAQVPLGRR